MRGISRALRALDVPAATLSAVGVAASLGLATFVLVYGLGQLLGTNQYWLLPQMDERMALMGYRYFAQAPWHWPLFESQLVNAPYTKSLVFLDCIPIWSLANKALASVVPAWLSASQQCFLGLWHGLAYSLQAVFGVLIIRTLGKRSWGAVLFSSLFFLALPTWIFRYSHPALSAHWVVLWAFYLYLRTSREGVSFSRLWLVQIGQLVVSALVSPYPAVMSLIFYSASAFRVRRLGISALRLGIGVVSVWGTFRLAGYFSRETAHAIWGFEFESSNLLSWFVPVHSGLLGDASWLPNVQGTQWQYEGYAYLGAGLLLLGAVTCTQVRIVRAAIVKHRWLFVVAVASLAFSLSNHVYFGTHEVISLHIPRVFRGISGQFRSPGRFVWIPTYVFVAFVVNSALERFRGMGAAFLFLCACLQLADVSGDWRLQRRSCERPHAYLEQGSWRRLIQAHTAVQILPPYPCVRSQNVGELDAVSRDVQLLASERALRINGTYSARDMRKCDDERRDWVSFAAEANTLYVILPPALGIADRLAEGNVACGAFAFGSVCSLSRDEINKAIGKGALEPIPDSGRVGLGSNIVQLPTLGSGWDEVDSTGRWTSGELTTIRVRVESGTQRVNHLNLRASALLCGRRTSQDVDVYIGATRVERLHFDAEHNDERVIRTVNLDMSVDHGIVVSFLPKDTRSAEQLGCGEQQRDVQLHVGELSFE